MKGFVFFFVFFFSFLLFFKQVEVEYFGISKCSRNFKNIQCVKYFLFFYRNFLGNQMGDANAFPFGSFYFFLVSIYICIMLLSPFSAKILLRPVVEALHLNLRK